MEALNKYKDKYFTKSPQRQLKVSTETLTNRSLRQRKIFTKTNAKFQERQWQMEALNKYKDKYFTKSSQRQMESFKTDSDEWKP